MTDTDRMTRWAATALAILAGLGLASAHWLGLVVGAALVALPQRTWLRGLGAGVAFGVLAFVVTVGTLALAGPSVVDATVEMGPLLGVSAGVAVVGGAVGGLVRGIVG